MSFYIYLFNFFFFLFKKSDYNWVYKIYFDILSMEQKKELIIRVLSQLKPYWDLAEGILALIDSWYADDQTIDGLIHIISNSIKKIKNESEKTALQKWLEKIQQIKMLEEDQKINEEDLDKLLADI